MQILSIDPGGTKCEICLSDENGNILGYDYNSIDTLNEENIEFLKNSPWGYGRDSRIIMKSILKIYENVEKEDLHIVFGGAVGALITQMKENNFTYESIEFSNEQNNAFHAAGIEKGYIVLSGTGAFVYSNVNETPFNMDGLGPIFGDFGGGCSIGIKAMKAAIKSEWSPKFNTSLANRINKLLLGTEDNHLGGDLIRYCYEFPNRTILGSFSKIVNEEADKGDEIAINILKEASKDLADTLLCSIYQNHNNVDYPAICYGGVISKSKIYYENFKEEVLKHYPNLQINLLEIPPCLGGNVFLAKTLANKNPIEFKEIIKNNFIEYKKKNNI